MSNHLNKLTEKKYSEMTNRYSKKSGLIKDCFFAFVFGGLICIIAQLFHDIIISSTAQKIFGTLTEENAKALTVMFMVFVGVLLTAFNVYDEIGNIAGAGTIVPITGFANSIVSPAMEFKPENIKARALFLA